jgi:phosphoglycolate phosphatase-like HAD superfamily hydrolase
MAKEFLVCIDSDGCAFDTMELKHKECFCPAYIQYFGLQPVSKYAREAWDFANLYSAFRGVNRFPVLLKALDVLKNRKEVVQRGFQTPELPSLRRYIAEGNPLNNKGVEQYIAAHPDDEEMKNVPAWSLDVNRRIGEMVQGIPPFPYVLESLQAISQFADIVIVSATETKALEREWQAGGLLEYVTAVRGQEAGSKKEIIATMKDSYAQGRVLMIGDAPGDRDAAKANDALFYPICPDEEATSWARFDAAMDAFSGGTYLQLQQEYVAYFEKLLPETPGWECVV